jgi:hypothetical protein
MADNYIKDTLKDVLRHTHSLGIFEMVKVRGTASETTVETVDGDKTVIFKGKTVNPVPDFVDATVGLSRMSVLDGYLKYPGFDDEGASVRTVTQERNGTEVPVEVEFVSAEGTNAHYRFMLADVVNQQLKDITFKGAEFDVNIVPSQKNLKDLAYFNGVLSAFESTFSPRTEDGKLYFYIGDAGGDRTKILVNEAPDGTITHEFKWPLDIVLKILRLGDNSNVVMSINAKGLLQIVVHSGLGEYTYLLPAKN